MKSIPQQKHFIWGMGPESRIAWCRIVPTSSAGTVPDANIVEMHGMTSARRLATAGTYEFNLTNKGQAIFPLGVQAVHSGSTIGLNTQVVGLSTTGSIQVQVQASGSRTDSFDFLQFACIVRVGT